MFFRLIYKPRYRFFYVAAMLVFVAKIAAAQEPVALVVEPSPFAWTVVAALVVVIVILLGILLGIINKAIGKEVTIEAGVKKAIEASYARKIRTDYQAKQALLDKKIEQVRQRFSMVMMKVKNLLDTLDPDELFKSISSLIEADLGASRYIVFLVDPVRNELYPFRWAGYPDTTVEKFAMQADHAHVLTYALKRKQTVYRGIAASDIELRKLLDREPMMNTLVAIPLFSQNKSYGVVHVESFSDGHTELDENEIRFLSSLPTFIGGALANADIFVQTREELTSAKLVSEQEIAEKRRLQEIFSRYTSPALIENLLKNPEKIDLGGVNKNAAILFTDIAGFTALSSRMSPKEVVSLMNEYLSCMTEVIFDYQGEIDKFIGDAIMARFGVLSDLAYPAKNAVEAACAMLCELDRLSADWASRGIEGFNIRVGIATGEVLAGNIGSSRRQEFTVMGSIVNLASRLESLNKDLGTRMLVDEATFAQLPRTVKHVKRENVRIRGLDVPITVYEILEQVRSAKVVSIQTKLDQVASRTNHIVSDSARPENTSAPGIAKPDA
ncbi:MAG: GAF domain-containing protein [Candidatus Riflebacteria bacterium]|nr:GAF domain-containing protein [Candidatus Riflebacteria bacterium]